MGVRARGTAQVHAPAPLDVAHGATWIEDREMNGDSSTPDESRRRLKGEGELTAQLITAASAAGYRLSQEEIDQILGVSDAGDGD